VIQVDLLTALLMLGSVSVPGGWSAAAPAKYWAWVRYFSAISVEPELRITSPFVDLDPHQRGILSDDFGVAIGTWWLNSTLGGTRDLVDGRRFLMQFGNLLPKRRRSGRKPAKVGPSKCPDYVLQDRQGRWHVLECKGTQSSRYYMEKQLKNAQSQKYMIDIQGAARGERLAAGVYLGNDDNGEDSRLVIVDPEPEREPLAVIDDSNRREAEIVIRRLEFSRALGMAGADALSDVLSLPMQPDYNEDVMRLLRPAERERLSSSSPEDRWSRAVSSTHLGDGATFEESGRTYVGKVVQFRGLGLDHLGISALTVKLGMNAEALNGFVGRVSATAFEQLDESIESSYMSGDVETFSSGNKRIIADGSLSIAVAEFD